MPFLERGAAALFFVAVALARLHDNIACRDEDDREVLLKCLKRLQNAAAVGFHFQLTVSASIITRLPRMESRFAQ